MGREVLQLEPMSSNKPQKPLIPLQIKLWRYILGEGQRECPWWSLHLFVISAQGGKGTKQAKTHSMARTQGTKVKQSFNSPATCFSWLPAHLKTFLQIKSETYVSLVFFGQATAVSFTSIPLRCRRQTGRSLGRKKEESAEECRNRVLACKHWRGSLSVHLCWCALTVLLSRFITLSQLKLVYKWKTKTKNPPL